MYVGLLRMFTCCITAFILISQVDIYGGRVLKIYNNFHDMDMLCATRLNFYTDRHHYIDVRMSAVTSKITSLTIVYSIYSGADERKHQTAASLALVMGIHRWPMDSPHKGPVKRKKFLLMTSSLWGWWCWWMMRWWWWWWMIMMMIW